MGLLFGFGGVILTALLGTVYEELTENYIHDLSTHIIYSLYGGYVGMQIGIGFDGYKYLKEKGRLKDFKRFFGQSVVGLVLGLLTFYYYLNLLTFILPMVGAIIGFDFGLIKKLTESEIKSS
jgi:hypothetical protein